MTTILKAGKGYYKLVGKDEAAGCYIMLHFGVFTKMGDKVKTYGTVKAIADPSSGKKQRLYLLEADGTTKGKKLYWLVGKTFSTRRRSKAFLPDAQLILDNEDEAHPRKANFGSLIPYPNFPALNASFPKLPKELEDGDRLLYMPGKEVVEAGGKTALAIPGVVVLGKFAQSDLCGYKLPSGEIFPGAAFTRVIIGPPKSGVVYDLDLNMNYRYFARVGKTPYYILQNGLGKKVLSALA